MNQHHLQDLFFNQGNRQAIEDVRALRLAQITSVDTERMVCEINILDKTSSRTVVPLPMPMAYPGGGIFAIPSRGAHVVVGIRPMQMPLILAYYPFNTMSPDSYFQMFKQVYGIPENFQEGEVFIRARGDSAKCLTCGAISLLTAWEANVDTVNTIERCPANDCNAPAVVMDPATQLPLPGTLNKQVLGSTLRMTPQADLFYQADNQMSPEKGDKQNIFKLHIEGKTGNVSFINAGDISFQSSGDFYVGCQNYTVKADNAITETTQNRNSNTNQTVVESIQDRVFSATNSMTFQAQTLSDNIVGTLSQRASSRVLDISGSDSYEASTASVFIGGDLLGNGRITQIGTATNSVVDDLELFGNEIRNVNGDSTATILGNVSATVVTGNYELLVAKGYVSIAAATGTLNLSGSQMILNAWAPGPMGFLGQAVARMTDKVLIDGVTDPVFIAYFNNISALLTTILAVFDAHTHTAIGLGSPTSPPLTPIVGPVPIAPLTATGTIISGNNTVLA